MKFNVGDTVKVMKGLKLKEKGKYSYVNDEVIKMCGKTGVITKIDSDGDCELDKVDNVCYDPSWLTRVKRGKKDGLKIGDYVEVIEGDSFADKYGLVGFRGYVVKKDESEAVISGNPANDKGLLYIDRPYCKKVTYECLDPHNNRQLMIEYAKKVYEKFGYMEGDTKKCLLMYNITEAHYT